MIFYIISIINIVIMIALISIIIIIAIIVVMIINSIIIIIIESGAHRQLLISFPIAEDIVRTTSKQNIDFCNHNILSVISRGQEVLRWPRCQTAFSSSRKLLAADLASLLSAVPCK